MSQWQLVWSPEALLDLSEHFEFIKELTPEVTIEAAQVVCDASFSIQSMGYDTLLTGVRRRQQLYISCRNHSYVIHYLVEDSVILIFRVRDRQQQQPR
jgi:plasmid stabilization system protein ParE